MNWDTLAAWKRGDPCPFCGEPFAQTGENCTPRDQIWRSRDHGYCCEACGEQWDGWLLEEAREQAERFA